MNLSVFNIFSNGPPVGWYRNDRYFVAHRYDFTSSGSSSNAGLAWVGAVCTTQSVSIVEDHFNFVIMTVAAHELGHRFIKTHIIK